MKNYNYHIHIISDYRHVAEFQNIPIKLQGVKNNKLFSFFSHGSDANNAEYNQGMKIRRKLKINGCQGEQ